MLLWLVRDLVCSPTSCCCCGCRCCHPPKSKHPTANKQSLEVDWRHMHTMEAMRPVAAACADAPRKVLRLFDQAAAEQVLASYPQFASIHSSVHVRVTGLPVDDSIRDLRCVISQRARVAQQRYVCKEGSWCNGSGVQPSEHLSKLYGLSPLQQHQ